MTGTTARLSLRYRPASDVLSGEVDVYPTGAEQISDSPDTDSVLVWSRPANTSGTGSDVLRSFHLVHATARSSTDSFRFLPAAVSTLVSQLMASDQQPSLTQASTLERVRAVRQSTHDLPIDSLRRPHDLIRATTGQSPPGSARESRALSAALAHLATAVDQRSVTADEREALRCDRLTRCLRELASVISNGGGRPAPGTSAAARAAIRGGIPLTANEQRTLRTALTDIDTPSAWRSTRHTIETLAAALDVPPQKTTT
ncbi:unannotated protein [freshwater metagenome]|uniref:Unannotated protein n=1 Tax=freshwater metagenome TaxID=449393 RepID=A0A6J7F317_9ZZZZ|nr:hypothetical protein [Actinomycetota bacterium]